MMPMKLVGFRLPPGPIPVGIETLRHDFSDMLDVRVMAQKDGALGVAQVFLSPLDHQVYGKSTYLDAVERILAHAADRARDMWLMDHETQQGWPPRDCLHGLDP